MESENIKLTITVPEAGQLLGVSRNKAYELARDGIIPTISLGRKLVVPKSRFLAWVNGGQSNELELTLPQNGAEEAGPRLSGNGEVEK